jgi:glycolate oxidase FAD binding subunit
MERLKPSSVEEAAEMISAAAAEKKTLEIFSGGSKRRLGRFAPADLLFDISALSGVIDYDPAELVLTARAATPMKEIEALLAEKSQMLAFEPPDWRGLLGGDGEPTIGGVLACNLAGPRRLRAGAARDFFLGFSAINGRGEIYKAGGKVVKNVTGYDLCKLQAGAYGTLSVLTEVTIKTMPRPEASCTLLLSGLADEAAIALMAQALNSPHEVSAAAHLPAGAAPEGAITALRLEGPIPSIAFRADALESLLGRGARLDGPESAKFWSDIGQVHALLSPNRSCVWRLCPTPSSAAAVFRAIREKFGSAQGFYDWGGGLVWLSLDGGETGADGRADFLRRTLRAAGGHATLVAASDEMRGKIAVFDLEPAPLAALSLRVKQGFDPEGILNPGRVQQGR